MASQQVMTALQIQTVSRAPYCFNDLGILRVVFDFFPKPAYVNGYGGTVAHIIKAPDLFEKLLFGKNNIRIFRQKQQKRKLTVGKFYLGLSLIGFPTFRKYC